MCRYIEDVKLYKKYSRGELSRSIRVVLTQLRLVTALASPPGLGCLRTSTRPSFLKIKSSFAPSSILLEPGHCDRSVAARRRDIPERDSRASAEAKKSNGGNGLGLKRPAVESSQYLIKWMAERRDRKASFVLFQKFDLLFLCSHVFLVRKGIRLVISRSAEARLVTTEAVLCRRKRNTLRYRGHCAGPDFFFWSFFL